VAKGHDTPFGRFELFKKKLAKNKTLFMKTLSKNKTLFKKKLKY